VKEDGAGTFAIQGCSDAAENDREVTATFKAFVKVAVRSTGLHIASILFLFTSEDFVLNF
jgi:hypothetical protein